MMKTIAKSRAMAIHELMTEDRFVGWLGEVDEDDVVVVLSSTPDDTTSHYVCLYVITPQFVGWIDVSASDVCSLT